MLPASGPVHSHGFFATFCLTIFFYLFLNPFLTELDDNMVQHRPTELQLGLPDRPKTQKNLRLFKVLHTFHMSLKLATAPPNLELRWPKSPNLEPSWPQDPPTWGVQGGSTSSFLEHIFGSWGQDGSPDPPRTSKMPPGPNFYRIGMIFVPSWTHFLCFLLACCTNVSACLVDCWGVSHCFLCASMSCHFCS